MGQVPANVRLGALGIGRRIGAGLGAVDALFNFALGDVLANRLVGLRTQEILVQRIGFAHAADAIGILSAHELAGVAQRQVCAGLHVLEVPQVGSLIEPGLAIVESVLFRLADLVRVLHNPAVGIRLLGRHRQVAHCLVIVNIRLQRS